MHSMREQFMVGMRAVFIYLYGLSFFVKGRRQVTYGSSTVITYILLKQEGKNHPLKIFNVNFLFLTTVDYK